MAEEYSRELLRRAVAQVCQLLGWHAIHSSPLAVLTHVLEKYLLAMACATHRYAEHDRRTDPTLDDLACAFRHLDVRLSELKAYAGNVPPAPLPHPVPPYPVRKPPQLNFLKPGSREVLTRPAHVHDHLPPMWPERELETNGDVESAAVTSSDNLVDNDVDPFKRPGDPAPNAVAIKRAKLKHPDDEFPARELSSVMMTLSGFLSPAREGKLPEARTPVIVPDVVAPERSKIPHVNPLAGRPTMPPPPAVEEKRAKKGGGKAVNGKVEKSRKREKPSKNLDRPYVPNENKSSNNRPVGKSKAQARNHVDAKGPALFKPDLPTFFPKSEPVNRVVKEEVITDRPLPPQRKPVVEQTPPKFPEMLPSPYGVHHAPKSHSQKATAALSLPRPPMDTVIIKEEKADPEKLTSQPDRSKLNIFKKISNKVKEEKLFDPPDRVLNDNVVIKVEKSTPPPSPQYPDEFSPKLERRNASEDVKPHNNSSFAVDLSSKQSVVSDVINVDDDFDYTKQKIKQEPMDDYPKDLSRSKISVTPHSVLAAPVIKEKKERKRKERKIKTEKTTKEMSKIKKQQALLEKIKNASEAGESPIPPNLPHVFPFLSMQPGLIPNRGLIPGMMPNPGMMPGGNLFSNLSNNPALRGLIPTEHLLPNPFSMKEATNNILSVTQNFLSSAPGLIPHGINNPLLSVNHSFGQPPKMPQPPNLPSFLRRPSLEVIPIDGDEDTKINIKSKPQFVSPSLVIKEKEKPKNVKLSLNNSFLSNSVNVSITNSTKHSPPKSNTIITMPHIKPDITIKLNTPPPPPEKPKIVDIPKPTVSEPPPFVPKEKDKSEKKKDKIHKKDKKDKEQRLKKKKDKKEKLKIKIEKKREKVEKQELKEKLKKDKKDKKKDREKPPTAVEGLIPKLTLKIGPPSPLPPSPDNSKRLNIKPVVKKEEDGYSPAHITQMPEVKIPQNEGNRSPELAKISALITRPPKSKSSNKHNLSKGEPNAESNPTSSPPGQQQSNVSPARKTKPTTSYSKYKKIHFKPIPKRNSSDFDDPMIDLASDELEITETPAPEKVPNVPLGTPFYIDAQGNKVWICPACGRPDNGTPMIACDVCNCWYHWVCVGVVVEPANTENWYCNNCIVKRTAMASAMASGQTAKKRGRKPKVDKLKENR